MMSLKPVQRHASLATATLRTYAGRAAPAEPRRARPVVRRAYAVDGDHERDESREWS